MISRSIGALALLCAVLLFHFEAARAAQPIVSPRAAYVPGEVLVGYHRQISVDERQRVRAAVGALRADRLSARRGFAERLLLPKGESVEKAVRRLKRDPRVRFAEPNYIVKKVSFANDPLYLDGRLWGMLGNTTVPANGYGSGAGEAWAAGHIGASDVYVGVLDEGVQVSHPDLVGNIWVNPYDAPNDGVDNDGNGYVDDTNGWDFFHNDASVYDGAEVDAHGTHVAGTIGANGGNGIGVAGVNWDVTIIPAKFLGPEGGDIFDAIRAIDYFIDLKTRHGLNIVAINNSWAGGDFSWALLDAINRAGDAGILFVAAASNEGTDNDTSSIYPANYTCTTPTRSADCVITVASIASDGSLSSFSNYGATSVDLAAPGSDIWSTLTRGDYAAFSGTSMAAPHVTGAAALCKAMNPTFSAAQIRDALLLSAAPTVSLAGRVATGGRLDIGALMGVCLSGSAPVVGAPIELAAVAEAYDAVNLNWVDDATGETYFEVQQGNASCADFVTVGITGPGSSTYRVGQLAGETTYCYRVRAGNGYPSTSDWSSTVTVTTLAPPPPYACSAAPYQWLDVSSIGTDLELADDDSARVGFGFAWPFYGSAQTQALVSSNGMVRFTGPALWDAVNEPIPSNVDPNGFVAPFWDDIDPEASSGAAIYVATGGAEPSRRFVVSWNDVPHFQYRTGAVSFQAVFEESTGDVVFSYRDVLFGSAAYDRGKSATVGLESPDGVLGTQVSYNSASLANTTSLRCSNRPDTPPVTPTDLVASALSASRIDLSWHDNADNETAYIIERASGVGQFAPVIAVPANATGYSMSGLASGVQYQFRLRALNQAVYSEYSNVATATTLAIPATPAGLSAALTGEGVITVAWSDVSGETGYRVERAIGAAGAWTALATLAADVAGYVDSGVGAAGETYRYRVAAFNDVGESGFASTSVTVPPAVPTGLRSSDATRDSLRIQWNAVPGAQTYTLATSGDGINWSQFSARNSTSETHRNLDPGTTYYYRVRANNAGGSSDFSAVLSATTLVAPPEQPTGLTALAGAGQIAVGWQPVPTATAYTLQRAAGATGGSFIDVLTAQNVTGYVDTNVVPGSTYRYRVIALNGAGSSRASAIASVTLAPSAPQNLMASSIQATRIVLGWNAAVGATGYVLERSANGIEWSQLATPRGTSFTHSNLARATTYFYRVRASNAGGASAPSDTLSVTTPMGDPPAVPTNLSVRRSTDGLSALVSWRDRSNNETGFEIGRQTLENGGWSATTVIGAVGRNVVSFVDTTGTPGTYRYWVRSVIGSNPSAWVGPSTSVATVAAPPPPASAPDLAASSVAATRIALGWSAVTGATSYTLENSLDGSAWNQLAAQSARAFTHSGLAPATAYYYRVRAVNGGGASVASNVLKVTTLLSDPPAAPTNLAIQRSSDQRSVTVSWRDRSNNETGFEVARQQLQNGTWSAAVVIAVRAPNSRSFVDTPGVAGTYRYLVRSVSGSASSGWVGPSSSVVTR